MIIVRYTGIGSTERACERTYESVLDAQASGWYPIGRAYGHDLYKKAIEAAKSSGSGSARDGRNIVEVIE